ncbi:MAG: uroporphyrinogen decarboxylase, partial [bacterium]|nr:uroporphyrinogen decarboxylase [bacterium]
VPNFLLAWGSPAQVREQVKKIIEGVAREGGYIVDASAIVQDDARVENMRAMTDAAREYGVYPTGHAPEPAPVGKADPAAAPVSVGRPTRRAPGACLPWAEEKARLGPISGDEALVRRIWEQIDGLGNMFIWQILLSF